MGKHRRKQRKARPWNKRLSLFLDRCIIGTERGSRVWRLAKVTVEVYIWGLA